MTTTAGADGKDGHAGKRKAPKFDLAKQPRGDLHVQISAGSVFDPNDDHAIPPAETQLFRVTILLAEHMKLFHKKKGVGFPHLAKFKNVPAGRYVVVVENLSDIPYYPGNVAEVRVAAAPKRKAGSAKPAAPTVAKVKLATDTLGAVARKCGFRVGVREDAPERHGTTLGDELPNYFNARIVTAFWSQSQVQHVPAPPVEPGKNVVVITAGPEQTPTKKMSWDGIPTTAPIGEPSLAIALPGSNPPSAVPMNLFSLRHATTLAPIRSGEKEVYGLLHAEQNGDGPGIPYGETNRLQITFVRRADGGNESALELVPEADVQAVPLRYFRYRPALGAAQYTALVWYDGNGKPPARSAAKKEAALMDEMAHYVADFVQLHKSDADGQRQHVVVNEALISALRAKELSAGRVGKKLSAKLLEIAQKKTAKALYAKLRKTPIPPALLNQWMAQYGSGGHWLNDIGRTSKYVFRAFAAAAPADPDAVLILNEHSAESIEFPKGLALAVLTYALKKRLGAAARRLAVGFQMHLKDRYYPAAKKKAFLHGLAKTMELYTRHVQVPVLVTEMGIRMPGFAPVETQVRRLQHACALRQLMLVMLDPGYDSKAESFLSNAAKTTDADGTVHASAELAIEYKVRGKKLPDGSREKTVTRKETVKLAIEKGVLSISGDAAGADTTALRAWARKNDVRAKALFDKLEKDGRFTNMNIWPDYRSTLDDIAKGLTPTAKQRREQADLFYKVARTCLSRGRCDDLSFWGVADSLASDTYDLYGFLFSRDAAAGSPAPGLPFFRKAAYFGVLQALIEAAIAKKRAAIIPYADAHLRAGASGGSHAYEEHLQRTY